MNYTRTHTHLNTDAFVCIYINININKYIFIYAKTYVGVYARKCEVKLSQVVRMGSKPWGAKFKVCASHVQVGLPTWCGAAPRTR